LTRSAVGSAEGDEEALERLGEVLIETLATFKVEGRIVGRTTGPVVTQYEVAPAPGVKVGSIAALADDLALAMRAKSIRIVAPIPGRAAVGVEVPNPTARTVPLREMLETPTWERTRAVLPIPLGKDLEGRAAVADLEKMPHLLIAGATGSGKSVCINTIITGLVYSYTPQQLRMLMIDPKMVELSMYNTLPHLRHPVVNDNKQAAQALRWTLLEMQRRYELFHANKARNISDFNRKVESGKDVWEVGEQEVGSGTEGRKGERAAIRYGGKAASVPDEALEQINLPMPYEDGPLPYIVIIVDELADLMMTVQGEVEKPLAMLAQKARATGIHMILATQRPSVNVITGLIKANFPSRIAFRVASKVDSRTILDQNGAETLLGNGDMLFLPPGKSEPVRVQGALIETDETEQLMEWYREFKETRDLELEKQGREAPESGEEDILEVVAELEMEEAGAERGRSDVADRDSLFLEAAETCISNQLGSTSLLQRKLRIGYGRAARIIDQLYEAGVLGPPDGSKPREVLVGMEDLDEL
jgi:S-DNA-T family DNA segregation ATPase FtsK/SpoIIIE